MKSERVKEHLELEETCQEEYFRVHNTVINFKGERLDDQIIFPLLS